MAFLSKGIPKIQMEKTWSTAVGCYSKIRIYGCVDYCNLKTAMNKQAKTGSDKMDREKVIKGLEICTSRPCYCTDCPYKKECCLDSQNVMEDALALLKEQKAVKPKCKERMGGFVAGLCPTCGTAINNILNAKACGKCGQAVKWE